MISIKEYFNNVKLDEKLLKDYGFIDDIYECYILNHTIKLTFNLQDYTLDAFDLDFNEPSINFNSLELIKQEWLLIIDDIKEKCVIHEHYTFDQAKRINEYIINHYQTNPAFLFDDYPNFGVYKNVKGKWFAVIMQVDFSKLSNNKKGMIEILNLKTDKSCELVNNQNIFKAYHMSKKYWITITLNDEIEDKVIFNLIDESFQLVLKKK